MEKQQRSVLGQSQDDTQREGIDADQEIENMVQLQEEGR